MTVIAAVHQDGATFIGADSQRSLGGIKLSPVHKLILGPGLILGVAGDNLVNELIRQHAATVFASGDPWRIGREIKALVVKDGFSGSTGDGNSLCYGSDYLLALQDGVWFISENFAMTRISDGELFAIGSGREIALGAGYAKRDDHPADRVRVAIQAACHWDKSCGGKPELHRVSPVTSAKQRARRWLS